MKPQNGQYRAEPVWYTDVSHLEGVETMHEDAMSEGNLPAQDMVRSAWEHADAGGNDRQTRVIYAAGFFDGEGWVSISARRTGQPFLVIGVGQLVESPLQFLSGLWGGAICKDKTGMYRWRIVGNRAAEALLEMLDFLLVKRSQAEIGLQFHDQRDPRPRRHSDDKERGRVSTRRFRARKRGEQIETPPRPKTSSETIARAMQFREELLAARP